MLFLSLILFLGFLNHFQEFVQNVIVLYTIWNNLQNVGDLIVWQDNLGTVHFKTKLNSYRLLCAYAELYLTEAVSMILHLLASYDNLVGNGRVE